MGNRKTNPLPARIRRVLDEAEDLFSQEGFLHFSTDELAQRLRCSKRAIYAIASGREKFFEAVIVQKVTRDRDAILAAIRSAPTVQAAVLGCIQTSVDLTLRVSSIWLRDVMLFPAGRRAAEKWRADIADDLEHLIERGIKDGLFRKVAARVAAEALLTSVLRMCEPDFTNNSQTTTAEAVLQVYEIFWSGLFSKTSRRQASANVRTY
jgi:AcrR family transcriptional regulator